MDAVAKISLYMSLTMVKSKVFIGIIVFECLLILAMLAHGKVRYHFHDRGVLQAKQKLVSELGLTDFAIWTEARYTRHPSQTDFFSAFQDFPAALEHFPAGAVIAPPQRFYGETE
ncbi:MAG: hypothetical protein ACI8ZB_003661 [Desulforhopalus sp.]